MAGQGAPASDAVDATGLRLGIVATKWHAQLVDHMVDRAHAAAKACSVAQVTTLRVAGSVELPVVAQALARRYDAVAALGVVIRGETAHFDYVCQSVTEGLTRIALDEATPVAHGVLTVESLEQAVDRAGYDTSSEDKGWAAVVAALDAAAAIRSVT